MTDFYRKESQKEWYSSERSTPTLEQINAGSLQRIADATEKMAASYDQMRNDRDYWQRRAQAAEAREQRLANRIRALRGVITRLKRSTTRPEGRPDA